MAKKEKTSNNQIKVCPPPRKFFRKRDGVICTNICVWIIVQQRKMLSLGLGRRIVSSRVGWRGYSSGSGSGVQQFYDTVTKPGERPVAGRAWRASELRLKSFSDLHKLWFVLLKEKNMLLTERLAARTSLPRGTVLFKNPLRLRKVKLSMARIQVVLSERQRVYQEAVASIRSLYLKNHRLIKARSSSTSSESTPSS